MPTLSAKAKPLIQAVFDKTYLEQAIGHAPWGLSADGTYCTYRHGCAIGRSLPKDLASQLHGRIRTILFDAGEHPQRAQRLLLGAVNLKGSELPEIQCYVDIQLAHDKNAQSERWGSRRGHYRVELEEIALEYGLTLPTLVTLPAAA